MAHDGRGRPAGAAQGSPASRLGGALNTVMKASLGAGIAVLGAYAFQRARRSSDLAARLERLDALVKELESKGGAGG